jgi:hypothetical protein
MVHMNTHCISYISPLVEARIPNASCAEKRAAQQRLWDLFDALYAVYLRLEREGALPLPMTNSNDLLQ